jgi:hypothetical protein
MHFSPRGIPPNQTRIETDNNRSVMVKSFAHSPHLKLESTVRILVLITNFFPWQSFTVTCPFLKGMCKKNTRNFWELEFVLSFESRRAWKLQVGMEKNLVHAVVRERKKLY